MLWAALLQTGEEQSSPVDVFLSVKCIDPPDRFSVIYLSEIPLSS